MNRSETQQILMVIQAAFPTYKVPDKTIAVNLWYEIFKDQPYKAVQAAVMAYISTDSSGFAPSPGAIRTRIFAMSASEEEMTEGEAWSMVSAALRNSAYHAEEEFAKLPPLVQRAVGSASQLHVWGTDPDYCESVESSNFKRVYRTVTDREKELRKIPESVRTLITGSGDLLSVNEN